MRPGETLFRVVTIVLAVFFTVLSVWAILLPSSAANFFFGISSINSSLASDLRFLNVLFLSLAAMLFLLYRDGSKYRVLLIFVVFGLLGGGVSRILGILVDGLPNALMLFAMTGEIVTGLFFWQAYRRSATPA